MIDQKIKRIDRELEFLKDRMEFGGPDSHNLCKALESVLRDLKLFDQKRLRMDQMEKDINLRFEAIALSLEKITKILKDNGVI
ncbi:MAG: hypothetical protein GTN38_03110 [Candidatus Aenigmarchaeota archaeon]|nr:hypothetical protein [Candidatus Aenigmarchaeota archaeon]NIP40653.1 hypothetical protein [Candidatus Aenigmarchaeota archaeon]NIQ18459.1 hypothetical protein [Candidatus Aenigmarchaeota archaeon]NIS73358.1 hypothetical protein [Candidatus Aenigmarchaeota archaeon]